MSWAACCSNKQMQDMFFGESSGAMFRDAAKGRREAACQWCYETVQVSCCRAHSCLFALALGGDERAFSVPSSNLTQTSILRISTTGLRKRKLPQDPMDDT
eukprot:3941403-Rhodomonas_salina.9